MNISRRGFFGALLVGACAYAGMAKTMVDAAGAHARIFKPLMPWRVATMATGGGWATAVLLPLVLPGIIATSVFAFAGTAGNRPT